MRSAVFSSWVQLIVVFPIVGAAIAYFGMKRGLHRARLLEKGLFATGKLVGKRETNVSENKRTVYELTFEFTGRDGRKHHARAQSSQPQRLQDEKQEPLLYDPENPERSYLLDEIPSRPKFDLDGQLLGKPSEAIWTMIIPLVVITVNILFALRYFRRID